VAGFIILEPVDPAMAFNDVLMVLNERFNANCAMIII
jgi:hypothetical protein